jgi:hypothetical protein
MIHLENPNLSKGSFIQCFVTSYQVAIFVAAIPRRLLGGSTVAYLKYSLTDVDSDLIIITNSYVNKVTRRPWGRRCDVINLILHSKG